MFRHSAVLIPLFSFFFVVSAATQAFSSPDAAMQAEAMIFAEIPTVTLPTRLPQPITQAPAAITVITADDIAHSGYTNVWDLLRSQPGVDVFQVSGSYAGVTIRGFNAARPEKVQVLLDGRSIFDPIVNGTFWTENVIVLEDIERIEIMRGPNSVLYGYNAFNGVINIVTKDPAKTKGTLAKVTAGTKKTQQYLCRFADTAGKLDYRLTYEKDNTQGLGAKDGKEILDGRRLNTANWRSRYNFSQDKNLEFLTGIRTGPIGGQEAVGSITTLNTETDYQQLKYNQQLSGDSGFYIQLFRNYVNKNEVDTPDNKHDISFKQYDLEFQHNFQPLKKNKLVWGGNWRRNEGRINLLVDPCHYYHDTIMRVFGQDEINFTDKFTYYCGLEWEQNNYTGSDWSTRQTAMYNLFRDHYLRATYARAYHAFGFLTYYIDLPTTVGNTDLERESIDAYELGYKGTLLEKKLSFDLEFFYNSIHKILYTISGSPGTYSNANRADAAGVEFSLEYMPYHWLKGYFNYSSLNVNDKTDDWKYTDPKQKANLGARLFMRKKCLPDYIDAKFSFVSGYKVSSVKIPQYGKLDITIGKKFFKDSTEVKLSGVNLLEPHHYEYNDTIKVDRQILGSVKVEF